MMRENSRIESKSFVLHHLSEGIYAAIADICGAADSNSGIIELGDQLVIFDSFLTPQAALELRRMVEELRGRTPQIVVNSHYHNDHIWGNQVFAQNAQIISSTRTRELIATAGMEEYQWYTANSAARLEALRAQHQNSEDEGLQYQQKMWICYYEALMEAMPQLSVCMPTITFDHQLELHGTQRKAELITFEGAHTGSDTVLHLPGESIIFMSDLLFVNCHPYLADGDPHQLLKALRELSLLNATHFVPGHGPVGTLEDVKAMIEYVEHCLETAQVLVDGGDISEEKISQIKLAKRFRNWLVPQFYKTNLRFLCGKMT